MALLVVAACFAASVIGGLIVARIARPPLADVSGAERAEAWSRIAGYAALHYGGTTERPGPEADFPREAVRWMVLADGTLYAPNVRMEGGYVAALSRPERRALDGPGWWVAVNVVQAEWIRQVIAGRWRILGVAERPAT